MTAHPHRWHPVHFSRTASHGEPSDATLIAGVGLANNSANVRTLIHGITHAMTTSYRWQHIKVSHPPVAAAFESRKEWSPRLPMAQKRFDTPGRGGHADVDTPTIGALCNLATNTSDLNSLFTGVVAWLAAALSSEWCAVLQHNPAQGMMQRIAATDWIDIPCESSATWAYEDAFPHHARGSEDILLVGDVDADPRVHSLTQLKSQRLASVMAAPIWSDHRAWGIIIVGDRHPNRYRDRDATLLKVSAQVVGMAIDRGESEISRRAVHEQLEAVLEGVTDGIIGQDISGNIVFANAAAAHLLGAPSHEAISLMSARDLFASMEPTDDAGEPLGEHDLPAGRVFRGSSSVKQLVRYRNLTTGEQRRMMVRALPVADPPRPASLVINILHDVHDVTVMQREANHHHLLSKAVEILNSPGLELNELLSITSRLIATHTGVASSIALASDDGRWLVPQASFHIDPDLAPLFRKAACSSRLPLKQELPRPLVQPATSVTFLGPNGTQAPALSDEESKPAGDAWVSLTGVVVPMHISGRILGMVTSYRNLGSPPHDRDDIALFCDLVDRATPVVNNARLHMQLADQEQRHSAMVDHLLMALESDRRRVAYDIHDGLAQVAASTYQHLEAFADQHSCEPAERADLEVTQALARRTIHEARRVIADLRPTVFDDFGLAAALREEIRGLQASGVSIEYVDLTAGQRFPRPVEVALFRVTQEALTNVRKHAGPAAVHVTLEADTHLLRLEVRDDGRGFDTSAPLLRSGPGERMGLTGMGERMALIGGTCSITSQPGNGTRVVVELPLEPCTGGTADVHREGPAPERPSGFDPDC